MDTCALFALAVVPDTEYTFICPVCRTADLSVHLVSFECVMMLNLLCYWLRRCQSGHSALPCTWAALIHDGFPQVGLSCAYCYCPLVFLLYQRVLQGIMGLIVTFSYMHIMSFDHIAIALLSLLHLVSHPPPPLFYFDIFKKKSRFCI